METINKIKENWKNILSVFLVVFFLIFFLNFTHKINLNKIKEVNIAGQNIKVELAISKEAQIRGLSDRSGLKENEGILFVFDHSDKYPFWMKDMNFPIDIIWIADDMKVVYIKSDARPELYPETYGSEVNAKYVLEVADGFSEKNNLKLGDSVIFY